MYDNNAEQAYLDSLLAKELREQDIAEEIDDLVNARIDELEAQGVDIEDIDVREIEMQVINDLREREYDY